MKIISRLVLTFVFFNTTLYAQFEKIKFEVELELLKNEYWWGGATVDGKYMPYGASSRFLYNQLGNVKGNQAQPLLISNKGRYLWSEYPLNIEFKNNLVTVSTFYGKVNKGQAGNTLKDAFLYVSENYFPPSGHTPDPLLFTNPQYNTWIELQYNQNEEDILKYARSVLDNGFPPGVIMIDDNWQIDYGVWEFSSDRFKDPKQMIEKLHEMGFKVMLWVCPFVSPDSKMYRELSSKKLLVFENEGKSLPAIVRWWNGASAIVDLTNPEGEQWYVNQLKNLQKTYNVDGFKLDAGDSEFYTGIFSFENILPNEHTEKHASIGLEFPLNEYRASWKMAGKALVQRLRDKEHSWEHLGSLIPDILSQGLNGYAFTCPDMIGGGEVNSFLDSSILDEELIVRSAQCHALMPMMQFSAAPWRILNQENLDICMNMANLHKQLGNEIFNIAKESAKTGEPIVRNMEYMFPEMGYEKIKDQFMLGNYILVAPVLKKGKTSRFVDFPKGKWKGDDGSVVKGPVRIKISVPINRLPWYRKVIH